MGREASNQESVWVFFLNYRNLFPLPIHCNASIASLLPLTLVSMGTYLPTSCQEYCIFYFSGEEFIFQIVADLPEEIKLVLHTSWKDFLPVAENLLARIKSYNSSLVPLEHGFNS